MFTLQYAKNPVWANDDGKCIHLLVKWEEFDEEHNFGATPYDPMPHGVDLYNRAKAGEFGVIQPYVAITHTAASVQPNTTGSQTL